MDNIIVFFYYFFHGILLFQVLIFVYLYAVSRKIELMYFSLFLLLLGINFILNSSDLYGFADHAAFMYSRAYNFINTPLVITANICYILFLKTFYKGITKSRLFFSILDTVKQVLWLALVIFLTLFWAGIVSNLLFNILHLLGIIVGVWLVVIIYKDKLPFKKFMVSAFICNLSGTLLTVCMLLLQNTRTGHVVVRQYPYIFIQVGLLFEIFFFNLAMLSKWVHLERESAIFELKSELAVEKIRNEISKELHDDIGGDLSGINLYSHIATQQTYSGNVEDAGRSLVAIQQASAGIINRLKDIIWAINPAENELLSFSDKIEEYANYIGNPAGFSIKMTTGKTLKNVNLTTQNKHHLFFICKEAVTNAVKYSGGNTVEIAIQFETPFLTISIADNGNGFDVHTVTKGNGLNNMQKRADEIGAKLTVQSKEGKGSLVSMQTKIT